MELTLEKNSVELGLELNFNSVEKRLDTRSFKEPLKYLLKVKLSKNALKTFMDALHIQELWESKLKDIIILKLIMFQIFFFQNRKNSRSGFLWQWLCL